MALDLSLLVSGFLKECGGCVSSFGISSVLIDLVIPLQVFSSPMKQILERLRAFGEFEVRVFFFPRCISLSLFYQFAKVKTSVRLTLAAGMSGWRRIACDFFLRKSFSKFFIARHPLVFVDTNLFCIFWNNT